MKAQRLPKKVRAELLREGERIARERGLDRMLGEGFRVLVRRDAQTRRVVFSFRALDDQSPDGVDAGWTYLR